ncbi:cytochrome c oxidase assembly protein [bacterium]|nr:cytochrome c oxidase assembly protein [bacterium]
MALLLRIGPHDDWRAWEHSPPLAIAMAVVLGVYLLAVGPWRRRLGGPALFPAWRAIALAGAFGLLYVAFASPIDGLGESRLFWVHMVQHMIIIYPVPALFLAALPPWLATWLLDRPLIAVPLRRLVAPALAFWLFNAIFVGWHFPRFYEFGLATVAGHYFEHLTMIFAGVVMWWPVFSPVPGWPRLAPGAKMLYIFLLPVAQLPLFGILAFSSEPLYQVYIDAPRVAGALDISALNDQVLGAAVMKVSAMVAYLAALAAVFFAWAAREGKRTAGG